MKLGSKSAYFKTNNPDKQTEIDPIDHSSHSKVYESNVGSDIVCLIWLFLIILLLNNRLRVAVLILPDLRLRDLMMDI